MLLLLESRKHVFVVSRKELDSAHSDIFVREYIYKVFDIKTQLQQGIVTQSI